MLAYDLHVGKNTIELTGNSVEYVLFDSFPFSEFKLLLLPATDKSLMWKFSHYSSIECEGPVNKNTLFKLKQLDKLLN